MAKYAVIAVVLATMLVASMAAADSEAMGFNHARALKQSFKCSDVKRLQNGGCDQVAQCVANANKSLDTPNNRKLFNTACSNCAKTGNSCPGDNSLPSACKGGLNNPAIMKCINQLAGH